MFTFDLQLVSSLRMYEALSTLSHGTFVRYLIKHTYTNEWV